MTGDVVVAQAQDGRTHIGVVIGQDETIVCVEPDDGSGHFWCPERLALAASRSTAG